MILHYSINKLPLFTKVFLLGLSLTILYPPYAHSQLDSAKSALDLLKPDTETKPQIQDIEPVIVNGNVLFYVVGIKSFPAAERAETISSRIEQIAKNEAYEPESVSIKDGGNHHAILADESSRPIVIVVDHDAKLEGISRELYAAALELRIEDVIRQYRHDRKPEIVRKKIIYSAGIVLLLILGIILTVWIFRIIDKFMHRKIKKRALDLEAKSHQIIQAEHIWNLTHRVLKLLRLTIIVIMAYTAINAVLGNFPNTRYIAGHLLSYVTNPLQSMGQAVVNFIPNLIFLIILFIIVRYLLKVLYQFFHAIQVKRMKFTGFDADWAIPTYRIVRVCVCLFGLVLAYPYIPGSQSEAFQGLTIMLGILFSLGSTSVISNMIAGYTMTYRRAFRLGDRVTIGNITGDVIEMRVLVTHVRSLKNEEVVIPNSTILNNEVINYSKMSKEHGLILHTVVGIGYETPWRQVEAMLKMAADRTRGLLKEPSPFVLQTGLGDFAVNYELNAYCRDEKAATMLYTELHKNIQDVFNEFEVQIMTPNYRDDTPDAKIVPKEQWYLEPATKPVTEKN